MYTSTWANQMSKEMLCSTNPNLSHCVLFRYLERQSMVDQVYHFLHLVQFCKGCYRKPFRYQYPSCGSISSSTTQLLQDVLSVHSPARRQKRFFDIASWLYTLRGVAKLDTNNISLSYEMPGITLRIALFLGEGSVKCALHL